MDRNFQIDELLIAESLKQEVIDKYPHNHIKEAIMQSIDREKNILQSISDFFIYRKSKNNLVITCIFTICIILTSLVFTLTPMKSFAAENIEKLMYWVANRDRNGSITELVQKPAEEVDSGKANIISDSTYLTDEEISNMIGYKVKFPNQITNGNTHILIRRALAENQSTGVKIPWATYRNATIGSRVNIEITKEGWNYKDLGTSPGFKTYQKNNLTFYLHEFESILYPLKTEGGMWSNDKTIKPEIIYTSNVEWEIDGVYYHLTQHDRDNYVLSNDEMIALAEDFASK